MSQGTKFVIKLGAELAMQLRALSLASISRLSPSKRTNCSVTFDPPVRKGGRGPGRSHHVMLAASVIGAARDCL